MSIGKNQRRFWGGALAAVAIIAMLSVPAGARSKKPAAPHKSVHKPAHKAPAPSALPPLTPSVTVAPAATPAPVAQTGDTLLYDGQSPSDAKITLSAWGGGTVTDTDVSFSKGHSLKVTTLDPYQGAKVTFQSPVDLGPMTDTSRVLIFALRLAADTRVFPQAPPPTQQSPDNGGGPDVPVGDNPPASIIFGDNQPRMIFAQVPTDEGNPGVPPGQAPPAAAPAAPVVPAQTLTSVHLIFTLANGAQADVLRPYPDLSRSDAGAGAEQWISLGIPLSALHFTGGSAASPLQSVTIAGNDYAVFYIGQIKTTEDTTPITCFAKVDEANIARDTAVTLRGTASGGFSALQYSWDFDASDGIADQANTPDVTTQYSKSPQDVTATLTVSDMDGIKKSATSTVILHVQ